ncbi:MAG: SDR family oxidoreductase [Verrucomicrobiota bacterium]
MRFKDQHVLVTGAATHTGYEIARQFSAEGGTVYVNDLAGTELEQAAASLRANTGGTVIPVAADLANASAVEAMFAHIYKQSDRLDVLVNNAALHGLGYSFVDTPMELLDQVLRANLYGLFQCSQLAARMMVKQGRGAIINLSSNTSERAIRKMSAYITSKGAVEALTRALAVELGPNGIRVNTVAPGYIHTTRWNKLSPEQTQRRRANVPLGAESTAQQVADVVLFLASDQAARINGSRVVVDGGCSAQLFPADIDV